MTFVLSESADGSLLDAPTVLLWPAVLLPVPVSVFFVSTPIFPNYLDGVLPAMGQNHRVSRTSYSQAGTSLYRNATWVGLICAQHSVQLVHFVRLMLHIRSLTLISMLKPANGQAAREESAHNAVLDCGFRFRSERLLVNSTMKETFEVCGSVCTRRQY